MTIAVIAGTALAADDEAKADTKGLTQMQKVSYCIGLDMGGNFKQMELAVDTDLLMKGLKAGFTDSEPMLSKDEIQEVMMQFQKEMMEKQKVMMEKQKEKMAEQGKKNKVEGEKFLAENKKKDGVKTTDSGLQYIVITEGKGNAPTDDDTVSVDYVGTLIDGTEFDSSYKRGQPATFPVKGVIKGWTEALKLMKPGSKLKLFIPSDLAYGERGAGNEIGPDATLIFEVELKEIKKVDKAAAPAAPTAPKVEWK
ncbi:FKBP-type peptidyl-prolyl cis-trans isomerase [bacterium]|nr:FKBP-type peptidyl-prolyl cis-trans isomerase [bacterium]